MYFTQDSKHSQESSVYVLQHQCVPLPHTTGFLYYQQVNGCRLNWGISSLVTDCTASVCFTPRRQSGDLSPAAVVQQARDCRPLLEEAWRFMSQCFISPNAAFPLICIIDKPSWKGRSTVKRDGQSDEQLEG